MVTPKRATRDGRPAKTPTEESLDVAKRLAAIIDQAERDGLAGTQTYVMLHKVMQEVVYKLLQGAGSARSGGKRGTPRETESGLRLVSNRASS